MKNNDQIEMVLLDDEQPLFLSTPSGMMVEDISTIEFNGLPLPVNIVRMPNGDKVPALVDGYRELFMHVAELGGYEN
jgi:hypothetical protein